MIIVRNSTRTRKLTRCCIRMILACCFLLTACDEAGPLKIGVLLPVSGPYDLGYRQPLEWARDNVNAAGGINGRRIQLVYEDLGVKDYRDAAGTLLDDSSIVAVIGTNSSESTFQLCPPFISRRKVFVCPVATSADIFRAFGGEKYIWRTVESDIAQMRTMFLVAARGMHETVALLTSSDAYGATFFDWFGFFATELDLQPTALVRYDQGAESCEGYMEQALAGNPDILFACPSDPETAACMVRQLQQSGASTSLLFTDGGIYITNAGSPGVDIEGVRGIGMSFEPLSGFNYAYYKQFNEEPPPYAANCYDALTLIAYGLQRSGGRGGEALADALIEVVEGRGTETIWDRDGIRRALQLLRDGELPDITGATGPLTYDALKHTDVTSSTYCLWEIQDGEHVCREYIHSGSDTRSTTSSALSIFQTLASEEHKQDLSGSRPGYEPPERTGLWAMIVSPSSGWSNYRHQSDALAVYALLKQNGVTDDRIILILADDIAYAPDNPVPGEIYNYSGGPNVYSDITIDYDPATLEPRDIYGILSGTAGPGLDEVISATDSENIFVYIVGHGDESGTIFNDSRLTPADFGAVLDWMYAAGSYRRMFIEVETCHGGLLGTRIDVPGVLLFAGANPWENSFAANYDSGLNVWLSDQFSAGLYEAMAGTPDISFFDLYEYLYMQVNGSHVSVYNYDRFGNLEEITLSEFITP